MLDQMCSIRRVAVVVWAIFASLTVTACLGGAPAATTTQPAAAPTTQPAAAPTTQPAAPPTTKPAAAPTAQPTAVPTTQAAGTPATQAVRIVLPFFPTAESGGWYAAKIEGLFEKAGFDVTLVPGGPQVSQ